MPHSSNDTVMAKRSFAKFAAESDPNLTVITADGGRIQAHNDVLRLVCSCLQNAPASDTWDLSSLLVNGSCSPVSQFTVEAVLSVIYSSMGALNYEPDSIAGQYSLQQLLDMLLFADAVGCSRAVMGQLEGLLDSTVRPQLEITLCAEDSTAEVSGSRGARDERGGRAGRDSTAGADAADATAAETTQLHLQKIYGIAVADDNDAGDQFVLQHRHSQGKFTMMLHLTQRQVKRLRQQVSQQLEALLFVGFKLGLQQLLQPALRFLRANTDVLLSDMMRDQPGAVFTPRVVAAASGACGAELLTRACLQRPLGNGFGVNSVFGNVKFLEMDKGSALRFRATLLQNIDEWNKGTRVEVMFTAYGSLMMRRPRDEFWESEICFGIGFGPQHTFQDSCEIGSNSESA